MSAAHRPLARGASVNDWQFAQQALPESNGTAGWICTRAETWRGAGSRVFAQFQAPSERLAPGAIAARAENSASCGSREARVLAGVLWKSRGGNWFVLAAGSPQVSSVTLSGGMSGTEKGNLLAVRAKEGARARAQRAARGRESESAPCGDARPPARGLVSVNNPVRTPVAAAYPSVH